MLFLLKFFLILLDEVFIIMVGVVRSTMKIDQKKNLLPLSLGFTFFNY